MPCVVTGSSSADLRQPQHLFLVFMSVVGEPQHAGLRAGGRDGGHMACKGGTPRWVLGGRDVFLTNGLCGAGSLIFLQGGKNQHYDWRSPSCLPLTDRPAKLQHPSWDTNMSACLGPRTASKVAQENFSEWLPRRAIAVCAVMGKVGKHSSRRRHWGLGQEAWHAWVREAAAGDACSLTLACGAQPFYPPHLPLPSPSKPLLLGLTSRHWSYSSPSLLFSSVLDCSWGSLKM